MAILRSLGALLAHRQRIETCKTSILPYRDCTIFVPKHPDTKPKLAAVKKSEEALAETAPEMIRKAVEDSEIIRV